MKVTIVTHRALGNHVAEEFLIDKRSIPLLFEIEAKQHSHLGVVRLIVGVHLGQKHVRSNTVNQNRKFNSDANHLYFKFQKL